MCLVFAENQRWHQICLCLCGFAVEKPQHIFSQRTAHHMDIDVEIINRLHFSRLHNLPTLECWMEKKKKKIRIKFQVTWSNVMLLSCRQRVSEKQFWGAADTQWDTWSESFQWVKNKLRSSTSWEWGWEDEQTTWKVCAVRVWSWVVGEEGVLYTLPLFVFFFHSFHAPMCLFFPAVCLCPSSAPYLLLLHTFLLLRTEGMRRGREVCGWGGWRTHSGLLTDKQTPLCVDRQTHTCTTHFVTYWRRPLHDSAPQDSGYPVFASCPPPLLT